MIVIHQAFKKCTHWFILFMYYLINFRQIYGLSNSCLKRPHKNLVLDLQPPPIFSSTVAPFLVRPGNGKSNINSCLIICGVITLPQVQLIAHSPNSVPLLSSERTWKHCLSLVVKEKQATQELPSLLSGLMVHRGRAMKATIPNFLYRI